VIHKTAVRGVESAGMLCSAKELGISDDASGLLALPGDRALGADLRAALALDDTLIELKVTPNRADCLSMIGLARDVAAAAGSPLVAPEIAVTSVSTKARREVRIEEPAACPRFASRTIEGIDPKAPSPAWMKERLERSGIRAISAVVDITNYVMLERGQPMHAFDNAKLKGGIDVRFMRTGERVKLLNGDEVECHPKLLAIADDSGPVGLGGVMGGFDSMVGEGTTDVFFEAAFFHPAAVQG